MISSRNALNSIDEAIRGVRRDEDRLTAMLRSATEDAARLRSEQAEAYKALARLKLDALAQKDVVGRLDKAEADAMEALAKRKEALAAIARRLADANTELAAAEKRLDAAADRLEAAIDAVEALTAKTKDRLAADKGWLAAKDKVATAEATATAAEAKAAQSESDLAAKRKPYDADALFTYLWKRGYGTSAYRAGPIARYFDARVARLFGYDAARPNYYMLNEIPLRLREHAERRKAAVEEAKAALIGFERSALEADGIARLEAEVAAADAAKQKLVAETDAMKAKLAEASGEQGAMLDPGNDQSLGRAIDGIAAAIAREDIAALHKAALETPTPEDEKIVAKLREIEPALIRREAEAEEVRKTSVALAKKRAELEESRGSFYREGYDDPRGRFDNGTDIGDVIGGVLGGMLSSRNLNDTLGRGWSMGGSGGSRGGSSFGGGLRFPGRPSSPSRGGGGFRTGGRF